MKILESRIVIAGNEPTTIELVASTSSKTFPHMRNLNDSQEIDCVSITNIGGAAVRLKLGDASKGWAGRSDPADKDAKIVKPGETAFLPVLSGTEKPTLGCLSTSRLPGVLAVATGRSMGGREEMAMVAQARAQLRA